MTQYQQILHTSLVLNILAIAYRCRWHRYCLIRRRRTNKSPSSGNNNNNNVEMSKRHNRLLYYTYLPVYLLAVTADWLQGPYKYSVYSAYGYDQKAISILFVAGFGSGMFLGSITGSLADTYGRKCMVIIYCVIYTFSCLAKHFRPFYILLFGRVLGGIATSLLFSVFDSWLIKAHTIQNIDTTYLSQSFSAANFGSSVVAILSGLGANWVVGTENDNEDTALRPAFWRAEKQWEIEQINGGYIGPPRAVDDTRWDVAMVYKGGGIRAFDLALIPLTLCALLAITLWDENYGHDDNEQDDSTRKKSTKPDTTSLFSALQSASLTVWRSSSIFILCVITSVFEGSMYIFILLWTPALRAIDVHDDDNNNYPGPPLGVVFATFMVCCMLGTSIFSILTTKHVSPSYSLLLCLFISSISCAIVAQTTNDTLCYLAMMTFECCIGAYYPAVSTIKGNIIAEDQRAAVYSVFRLPLNAFVLINLYFTNHGYKLSFGICSVTLLIATILQIQLVLRQREGKIQNVQGECSNNNNNKQIDLL